MWLAGPKKHVLLVQGVNLTFGHNARVIVLPAYLVRDLFIWVDNLYNFSDLPFMIVTLTEILYYI